MVLSQMKIELRPPKIMKMYIWSKQEPKEGVAD